MINIHPMERIGYEVERPGGAFYIFPRSPIPDDIAFVRRLAGEAHVLTVPGSGFGRKGHFRIAYCVDNTTIEGSLPGFERVFQTATGMERRVGRTGRRAGDPGDQ